MSSETEKREVLWMMIVALAFLFGLSMGSCMGARGMLTEEIKGLLDEAEESP